MKALNKYQRIRASLASAVMTSVWALAVVGATGNVDARASALPRPRAAQAAWEHDELGMFFHFDIEVFDQPYQTVQAGWRKLPPLGSISAKLFNPKRLDTNQWLRVARAMGARYAVFTAKHSSGFLMWPSRLYSYGVRQATWKGGKGDVVRDFMVSCRRYGIAPGLYCSAGNNSWWVLHHGRASFRGGKAIGSAGAVRNFLNMDVRMYTSLWKHAGPLAYMWFDGGVDPLGSRLNGLLRRYEPGAVCFNGPVGAPGGLARWSGNEHGFVNYPNWNMTDTTDDQKDRGPGSPAGHNYIPVEGNVPLRYHFWMWKSDTVKDILPLNTLMKMYLRTVGRGANFIINANIDPDGLVPAPDARRLTEFGAMIRRWFGKSVAETSGRGTALVLQLPHPTEVNFVMIQENIALGQRVRAYRVEGLEHGTWKRLCRGKSVGEKRIQQFAPATVDALRLTVTHMAATPVISRFAAFRIHTLWRFSPEH